MADNLLKRYLTIIFDRDAAKKAEDALNASMAKAGEEGGKSFLTKAREQFAKTTADLKVLLAKGIISPEDYKKGGQEAAKAFNVGILKGMEDARSAGNLTDQQYLKLARTLKTIGSDGKESGSLIEGAFKKAAIAVAGFFAARRVADFLRDTVKQAVEADASIGHLSTALGTIGLSYAAVSKQAEGYFAQLERTTRFTDNDAREALASLITITGNYDKSLQLLSLTAAVAIKRHTTMAEAAETVGKASLGLAKGLGDLGIQAGATGDLIAKLSANLGTTLEDDGKLAETRLIRIANAFDKVKEKLGLAIINGLVFSHATGSIQDALVSLGDWIDAHQTEIQDFTNNLIAAASAAAKVAAFLAKNVLAVGQIGKGAQDRFARIAAERAGPTGVATTDPITAQLITEGPKRRQLTEAEQAALTKIVESGGDERTALTAAELKTLQKLQADLGAGTITLAKEQSDALTGFFKARGKAARDAAAELKKYVDAERTRLEQEASGDEVRAANNITLNAQALERWAQGRRDADNAATVDRANKAQGYLASLERETDAINRRNEAERKGPDAVAALDRELFVQQKVLESGADAGSALAKAIADMAGAQYDAARNFSTPWVDALGLIKNEVLGSGHLFEDLGKAWAEGGFKGVVAYAKAKVKENIAAAIEEAAKAFGALALGNPAAAALHAKSAVEHGAAAAAWGIAAKAGGGGASAPAGGAAANTSPSSQGSTAGPPQQSVTIVLEGPGFDALNPRVQDVVWSAVEQARERIGQNTKIQIVRRS